MANFVKLNLYHNTNIQVSVNKDLISSVEKETRKKANDEGVVVDVVCFVVTMANGTEYEAINPWLWTL